MRLSDPSGQMIRAVRRLYAKQFEGYKKGWVSSLYDVAVSKKQYCWLDSLPG